MGEGPKRGDESGCSSSATCERSPGTGCWHSGRARSQAEKLSAPRITPSRIKSAGLRSCFDFLHFRRLHSKSMNSVVESSNQSVDDSPCLVTDEPLSRVAPVYLPPAFITTTTTTCRGGQHTSYQTSPSMLPVWLRRLASCTLPRYNSFCEMFSEVEVRRSMTSPVFKTALFLIVLIGSLSRPISATMDITAFEYQQKFHKPLDLGECSQREVTVDLGNNTFHTEEQRCTLQQRGVVTHLSRELNDSRNALITSANAIVNYLGLCGGEAASFLGILNSGDCVAIEIASQLTFSNKTMIRAFVGYYRQSLDILEEGAGPLEGMDTYYNDKFYLKNRSYGTLEIIFVQFRFDNVRTTDEAKNVVLDTPVMSAYMREVQRITGTPKNIVVISLSTATQEPYKLRKFKREEWERGLRYVEILELTIQKMRLQINSNAIVPHLKYQLQPFVASGGFRLTKPVYWEEISMLEVQLRQAINLMKKTVPKCRGNTDKACQRALAWTTKLTTVQSEIHKGRANWVNLTAEEKNQFATRYTTEVNRHVSVTHYIVKDVRKIKNKQKLEKLERKKNKLNQIPVDTADQPPKRQHRIRHAKSRKRLRNGQGR